MIMKKNITLFLMMLVALVGFQMRADMWIIGEISPDGWNPSAGVQMSSTDGDTYTVDIEVASTGNKYFSLTSKLGSSSSDWDGIKSSRFGGNKKVAFDTETVLEAGSDQSPYCAFEAGTYTFTFKVSTKTLVVHKNSSIDLPTFGGTIYVSKSSVGNIWAWDADGNYFDAWPGVAVSTLSTTTVKGTEYYYFTYSHNTTSPGLIFNDGTAQTANITPEDGKVYTYTGGATYTVSEPQQGEDPDPTAENVYILGSVNGKGWSAYDGVKMNYDANAKIYSSAVTTTGADGGFSYFSFTTKLAEPADTANQGWDAIAPYRFGSVSLDDFQVTKELLGEELEVSELGSAVAFKIPGGTYTFTLDMAAHILVITGEMNEIVETGEVYILGEANGNAWDPSVGVKMEEKAENVYEAKVSFDGANEGYSYFSFTKKLAETSTDWDGIAAYRFGANATEDFLITEEHMNKVVGLGAQGTSTAFMIAEGKYVLTVDLANGTLMVSPDSAPALLGDVDGNGTVDVSDVTSLINAILGSTDQNAACDVDGNGTVDVSDVTYLINLILV